MSDRLFGPATQKKRKRSQPSVSNPSRRPTRPKPRRRRDDNDDEPDETVGAFDNVELDGPPLPEEGSGDEIGDETPAQKRLRLAKLYLETVRKEVEPTRPEDDEDETEWKTPDRGRDLIEARLQKDVVEHSGRVYLFVGASIADNLPNASTLKLKAHRSSITSAVASETTPIAFSTSKDGSIVKWDLTTGKRLQTLPKKRMDEKGKSKADGHTDEVWTLAISTDGKYLVSGGKDRRVFVWDIQSEGEVKFATSFGGHKDSITGLAFRRGTHQLFSSSYDRTIKLFDLSPQIMGYIETLFGHQDVITSIDALRSETAISSGSRDRSVRFWKVPEESQLVFRGGGRSALRDVIEGVPLDAVEAEAPMKPATTNPGEVFEGSIECVAFIDESTFVSGGDSGAIRLWSTNKKKAIFTQNVAHGWKEVHSNTEDTVRTPRWITSLAVLRYSDTFASGSWDGTIRLWKLDERIKSFSLLSTIPLLGVINCLQIIAPSSSYLMKATWRANSQLQESDTSISEKKRNMGGRRHVLLVAGVGQEPRLGRWFKVAGSRNVVHVIAVPDVVMSTKWQ